VLTINTIKAALRRSGENGRQPASGNSN